MTTQTLPGFPPNPDTKLPHSQVGAIEAQSQNNNCGADGGATVSHFLGALPKGFATVMGAPATEKEGEVRGVRAGEIEKSTHVDGEQNPVAELRKSAGKLGQGFNLQQVKLAQVLSYVPSERPCASRTRARPDTTRKKIAGLLTRLIMPAAGPSTAASTGTSPAIAPPPRAGALAPWIVGGRRPDCSDGLGHAGQRVNGANAASGGGCRVRRQ